MADRSGEKAKIPFTHVQHVGGAEERESGESRKRAAERQQQFVAETGNPENKLREQPDGSFVQARNHPTPKPVELDSSLQTKNRIP